MTHPTPPDDDVKALRDALAALNACKVGGYVARLHDFEQEANPERIARLLARLEQAERDARRYQLLRDSHPADKGLWVALGLPYSPAGIACFREESLDAAIDAHIAAIASEAKT